VARASRYVASNADRLSTVPPTGALVPICELGSHCRGADFLDGGSLVTPALEAAAERAARACPGFAYGRFDVRARDASSLESGEFTILELNGVTSEPTHIYDPRTAFWQGVRTLSQYWTLAFEIGAAHRRAGARTWSLTDLVALALAHRRFARCAATSPAMAVARAGR
jgi:hypothetical protein